MITKVNQPAALHYFHPAVTSWFSEVFDAPTNVQEQAWPAIASGKNTLMLAPTGSGKTLASFLVAIDRIMFPKSSSTSAARDPKFRTPKKKGIHTLYISPLKALGVDIERNLRSPLAGVRVVAEREGFDYHLPAVGVRSGDTPAKDRYRMTKEPPDILITTPESLYLLLTSRAREILTTVETVIIDEIHSMVATKRGSHLFVSLERLEQLRRDSDRAPLQRIGLSATQRPLDEVARLLGGGEATANPDKPPRPRPVEIVAAGTRKQLELRIEVPVDDMARMSEPVNGSGAASAGPKIASIWPALQPRLVSLIREHRSTMIFVNSRRLAERMAQAINELAEEEIALAHHGSLAKDQRAQIEDALKRGTLPAIVATSSLELGIDMGAVDLVIQIEAPPSIASGLQRIGRAGHQVGAPSNGVVFPKYRGDLLACSAAVERMIVGQVEETFYPRNPLDVLAQQIVAMVGLETQAVDRIYSTIRSAAPFFDLPRSAFEGVLDLLSGRYPSDEFSELRPRLTWDRLKGEVSPRRGTQRVAIVNVGTIPDRGLYGVFLADGTGESSKRVGELDEEMVFETRPGDVFLLGASSWRAVEITHDRVLVVPAPGEPGRLPFWRADGPGRPLEFGQAIGALARKLARLDRTAATSELVSVHQLDARAATNLVNYIQDQTTATEEVPSDKTIVVESFIDEVGDWRVCVLSPFGSRVHAPWATAVQAQLRAETSSEVDVMWSDDGMVFRVLESDDPPEVSLFFPKSDEIEDRVVKELGSTALFASHFRENAARALLLPKRTPGKRSPLWLQRRKSADLLQVASRYDRFPIMLETYRECLRDVFDLPGLQRILQNVERRAIGIKQVTTESPSPFAASLLFNYVGNFVYNGDAPLAERRAATLALDHAQLRELLGDADLRELLDADVVDEIALELQRLDAKYPVKDADGIHELLLQLGDLSRDEITLRCGSDAHEQTTSTWIDELLSARRIVALKIAGEKRLIAAEDSARYRDALGIVPPIGLPEAFLAECDDPLGDLVSRFARTHAPFKVEDVASHFGVGVAIVREALSRLLARDRLVEGEFTPNGRGREWCDANVLKRIKRRSLARLRKEVEPVEPAAFGRFLIHWQGLDRKRRGLDRLLDAIEQLQGCVLPASVLEREILPARVENFQPSDLDALCNAGEIVWRGHDSIAGADGRISLFLADATHKLAPPADDIDEGLDQQIYDLLQQRGAIFFDAIVRELGGFKNDVVDALWRLVWVGRVTNDTLAPLRSLMRGKSADKGQRSRMRRGFRSRRAAALPGTQGRWSIFDNVQSTSTPTERMTAIATQLIERYGVVTRELVASESIVGGFSGMYPIFKAMEDAGRVRRGYFIAGQGAAQFAAAGAEDRLRERRSSDDEPPTITLAATDPANPYGTALKWPHFTGTTESIKGNVVARAVGSLVILRDGALIGYLSRTGKHLVTFLPEHEPERSQTTHALIKAVEELGYTRSLVIEKIDDRPAVESHLRQDLEIANFIALKDSLVHRSR